MQTITEDSNGKKISTITSINENTIKEFLREFESQKDVFNSLLTADYDITIDTNQMNITGFIFI